MSKKKNKDKTNWFNKNILFGFMSEDDDNNLPDGAWFAKLEDSVAHYNSLHGTNFDENDLVHEYLEHTYPSCKDFEKLVEKINK